MAFGERLRALRREKKINQRTLARVAGIDVTYLSKIETGAMDPPAAATVQRLAAALDQDPTELLLLAKKIPPDVRDILTDRPEVVQFLRTTKRQQWGPAEWRALERKAERRQLRLFDAMDDG